MWNVIKMQLQFHPQTNESIHNVLHQHQLRIEPRPQATCIENFHKVWTILRHTSMDGDIQQYRERHTHRLSVIVQYSVHSGGREVLIRIVYYIITRDNVEVTDLCWMQHVHAVIEWLEILLISKAYSSDGTLDSTATQPRTCTAVKLITRFST